MPDLPDVEHRFIDLPTGVRMHVAQAGPADAPPVVCLHGWPQHWWIWRRVIPLLSAEHRVVCPDNRGAGWSGWPDDGDFRKPRLVDDTIALLDALDIDTAHVLGHDWGAWTGMLLAVDAPERLRTLLALGIVHPWQPTARAIRNGWRFAYQVPLATPVVGERLQRQPGFVTRVLKSAWGGRETFDDDAAALYEAAQREPTAARAGHRMYRSFVTGELWGSLAGGFAGKRLGVPSRLLIGSREPLGTQLAEDFERHGDDATWDVLEGCGHFVPEERPERVVDDARTLFAKA